MENMIDPEKGTQIFWGTVFYPLEKKVLMCCLLKMKRAVYYQEVKFTDSSTLSQQVPGSGSRSNAWEKSFLKTPNQESGAGQSLNGKKGQGVGWFERTRIGFLRCGCCLVCKSCSTLCDPMDSCPPDSSDHGISQARKTLGVGCLLLLQGIFSSQKSNPHLLNWQADSLSLNHQGSP